MAKDVQDNEILWIFRNRSGSRPATAATESEAVKENAATDCKQDASSGTDTEKSESSSDKAPKWRLHAGSSTETEKSGARSAPSLVRRFKKTLDIFMM